MQIKSVTDNAFARYGKVIEGYDFGPLLGALRKNTTRPHSGVEYVPGFAPLESLDIYAEIRDGFYGGMPIQMGYCNGSNKQLGCLEYHRDSELNVVADDIVLLVAPLEMVKAGSLDTGCVEAFLAPRGSAVQLYETTLHYAPCNAPGGDGFQVVVVLPKGTNTDKPEITARNSEDKLLWARNKWLIAHPDSPEAAQGAFVGLTGENIVLA